jgi:DNA-binding CsgD family transcriptional regulator
VNEEAFERTALVNDFLNKWDTRYVVASGFPVTDDYGSLLSLMRARKRGRYDRIEKKHLSLVVSHLRRALVLNARLGALESSLTSLESLVSALGSPVFIVDRNCKICHVNLSGEQTLREGEYLTLSNSRIVCRNAGQSKSLHDAVKQAAAQLKERADGVASQTVRLVTDRRTAIVIVQPLYSRTAAFATKVRAEVALFLTLPGTATPAAGAILRMAFNLTAAETRLAEQLLSGTRLADIADRLSLSRETLKSQLAALFGKTGTNRQAELTILLQSTISLPLR